MNISSKTMRTIALTVTLVGNVNSAVAQQMDVDNLTDYEKSLHRWAWCKEVYASTGICEFGCFDISAISNLLSDNNRNSDENDPHRIYRLARNDTEAELLLGKIQVTKIVLEQCESDMLQILKNEYVPNFSYLK